MAAARTLDPRAAAWKQRVTRIRSAYLADELTQPVLAEELERLGVAVLDWHGLLALSPDPPRASAWALDVWTDPELVDCASIGLAAAALRNRQRNWSLYSRRPSPTRRTDRGAPAAGEGTATAVSGADADRHLSAPGPCSAMTGCC